ncbi:MAG: dockerin type I domain-containing protein [Candidatus Zixiibacteriota bacterium]
MRKINKKRLNSVIYWFLLTLFVSAGLAAANSLNTPESPETMLGGAYIQRLDLPDTDLHDIAVDAQFVYTVGDELSIIDLDYTLEYGFERWYINQIYTSILGSGNALEINNQLAYVASEDSLFKILDISDPSDIVLISSININAYAYDLAIYANYAYISTWKSGIIIIDFSDIENPYVAGQMPSIHSNKVLINDNLLYLGYGLLIYSLNDPLIPFLESQVDVPATVRDMKISGNQLFLASAEYELMRGFISIIDITDIYSPVIENVFETAAESYCLSIKGDYAVAGSFGFERINITDLENVHRVEFLPHYYIRKIEVFGDWYYMVDRQSLLICHTDGICGDINNDGTINVGDAVRAINCVFKDCFDEGTWYDANCDGSFNIGDAVYLINHIFKYGPRACEECE